MNTRRLCWSSLLGVTMASLWAAPALAQDASTTVVVEPTAPAPSPVVVSAPSAGARAEGSPTLYPGLIWGGVAIWAAAYSASAIAGAVANDACTASTSLCITGRQIMYVPVVGAFAAIPNANGPGSSTTKTLLADGAFQVGGLAMMVTGIVLSASARPVRASATAAAERRFVVAPYATPSSAGFGAIGRF